MNVVRFPKNPKLAHIVRARVLAGLQDADVRTRRKAMSIATCQLADDASPGWAIAMGLKCGRTALMPRRWHGHVA